MDIDHKDAFPTGVVVYFRILAEGINQLACSVHPSGRQVELVNSGYGIDYAILDDSGRLLGQHPREFVAAICPLGTHGPAADANLPI